ncbi:MAG TPA: beta-ketoacyl synthase N-terminal-like domain-containing protein, partial [Thermoanaerobaculia bacterium]|nr:beta-ketoacyl synthase N-terminal-like domain-containing protein [Thermoanaerobaculia bacterium]
MKPIYIAAYQQSKFGKLMGATVPEIIRTAAEETCRSVKAEASTVDLATIGAVCNLTLNEQGLLSGLLAMTPGLGAKPIESVENACATGGQAILAVAQKLMLGEGDVGLAVGFEKMRDAEGKMDGKLIGKVLG